MGLATYLFLHVLLLGMQNAFSTEEKCIRTQYDLQQSVVNRTVNMESLNGAFSPTNHQDSISFYVYYHFCSLNPVNSSLPSCSALENWVHGLHSGKNGTHDFSERYVYKFLWNASPINLFIRPDLLQILSLYMFQVNLPESHLILDPVCDDVNESLTLTAQNESYNEMLDICRDPPPILVMLESITVNLKSFYLHKQSFFTHGTRKLSEQGYPTYYLDPRNYVNDVCSLKQVNDFMKMRYAMAAAIILIQLMNPIAFPVIGQLVYNQLSEVLSESKHFLSFIGFLITFFLLGVAVFVWDIYTLVNTMNVMSSFKDIWSYYIIFGVFAVVYNPLLLIITLCCTLKSLQKSQSHTGWWDTLKSNQLYVAATSIVEFNFNLLSLHFIYIFLGLVAAPVATGFNLGLATTIFFITNVCLVMFLVINKEIMISLKEMMVEKLRGYRSLEGTDTPGPSETSSSTPPETSDQESTFTCTGICTYTLKNILVLLVWMMVISYCVFLYMIAAHVGPYTSTVSLLVFIVSLFPAMLSAIFPMVLNKATAFFKTTDKQ